MTPSIIINLTVWESIERFYEAFNDQDLDAFVSTLHDEVELQTMRGLRRGLEEARSWATKKESGDLDHRVMVEELREHHNHVVAMLRQEIAALVTEGVDFVQLDEPVLTEVAFAPGRTRTFMCAALASRKDPA